MIGQFFAAIGADPRGPEGRMLIKIGKVLSAVGPDRFLLQFEAKGYKFSNVVSADQLGSFAFFDSIAAREQFVGELLAQNVKEDSAPKASDQLAGSLPTSQAEFARERLNGLVGSPNAISSTATESGDSAGGATGRRTGRTSRRGQ